MKVVEKSGQSIKAVGVQDKKKVFPIFCSFNLLDVENQMLFTEFKNLSSLSRYETSKWAWFSENVARCMQI